MTATESRFWSKVNKTPGCWVWAASKNTSGYGHFYWRTCKGSKKSIGLAHRYSYQLHIGIIPNGMQVLHKCDIRHCVNPAHLFLGTNRDNVNDMLTKNRQAKGERSGKAHLTEDQIPEIIQLRARGFLCKQIASMYGVSYVQISRITRGKTWIHIFKEISKQ